MNSNISLFQYTFANRSLLFADELSMAWKIIKAICFDEKKKTCCDHFIALTETRDHFTIFFSIIYPKFDILSKKWAVLPVLIVPI